MTGAPPTGEAGGKKSKRRLDLSHERLLYPRRVQEALEARCDFIRARTPANGPAKGASLEGDGADGEFVQETEKAENEDYDNDEVSELSAEAVPAQGGFLGGMMTAVMGGGGKGEKEKDDAFRPNLHNYYAERARKAHFAKEARGGAAEALFEMASGGQK